MTMLPSAPEAAGVHAIRLTEWQRIEATTAPILAGSSLSVDPRVRAAASHLAGKLDIRPGFGGLELTSSSWVGHVDVGPLRVSIEPKLPRMPLGILMRYAYGLRDLALQDDHATPAARGGMQQLLVDMLIAEAEDVVRGGLARRYLARTASLGAPRGRIAIDLVARRGGLIDDCLPCRFVERRADWSLNRLLRTALDDIADLCDDAGQRHSLHRLAARMDVKRAPRRVRRAEVTTARAALDRLTATYEPSLTLVDLLLDAHGIAMEEAGEPQRMRGFLFDMNRFFQRLIERFLREELGHDRVRGEIPLRGLFTWELDTLRRPRMPRPDFGLYDGSRVVTYLDAKYRDLHECALHREWLYQTTLYALASPRGDSIVLYPTLAAGARDESIRAHPSIARGVSPASVVLRPVQLEALAELVRDRSPARAMERKSLAARFCAPHA